MKCQSDTKMGVALARMMIEKMSLIGHFFFGVASKLERTEGLKELN